MIQKISNMLMLALVFLLPWQTRFILEQGMINGNQSEYLTLSVYGIDLLVVLSVAVKIFTSASSGGFKSTPTLLFQRRGLILGTLFVLLNALSIFWAADKLLAVQHVVWILLAAGLAWLAMTYENKARLIFWFMMGLMMSAWLGIWQFFAQYAFANKWLGLAAHDRMAGGASIVEIYASDGSPIRWLRAYGSFDHPNIFGMMMAFGIILTIAELTRTKYGRNVENEIDGDKIENTICHSECSEAESRNLGLRSFDSPSALRQLADRSESLRMTYLLYFALVGMSAGLFASLSRSAWAGLTLGIIFMLVITFGYFKSTPTLLFQRRGIFKPVMLVGLVFAIMAAIYPAQFAMRSGGEGRLETKSINERATYFEQGKEIIRDNVLLGVGTGNYLVNLSEKNPDKPAWLLQPVHDVPMLAWAELGIFGMLMIVALFATACLYTWRNRNVLGTALLLSLTPALLLDHWLWSLHFGLILSGFLIGITLKYNRNKAEIK